jgi:hypothetical protein
MGSVVVATCMLRSEQPLQECKGHSLGAVERRVVSLEPAVQVPNQEMQF